MTGIVVKDIKDLRMVLKENHLIIKGEDEHLTEYKEYVELFKKVREIYKQANLGSPDLSFHPSGSDISDVKMAMIVKAARSAGITDEKFYDHLRNFGINGKPEAVKGYFFQTNDGMIIPERVFRDKIRPEFKKMVNKRNKSKSIGQTELGSNSARIDSEDTRAEFLSRGTVELLETQELAGHWLGLVQDDQEIFTESAPVEQAYTDITLLGDAILMKDRRDIIKQNDEMLKSWQALCDKIKLRKESSGWKANATEFLEPEEFAVAMVIYSAARPINFDRLAEKIGSAEEDTQTLLNLLQADIEGNAVACTETIARLESMAVGIIDDSFKMARTVIEILKDGYDLGLNEAGPSNDWAGLHVPEFPKFKPLVLQKTKLITKKDQHNNVVLDETLNNWIIKLAVEGEIPAFDPEFIDSIYIKHGVKSNVVELTQA